MFLKSVSSSFFVIVLSVAVCIFTSGTVKSQEQDSKEASKIQTPTQIDPSSSTLQTLSTETTSNADVADETKKSSAHSKTETQKEVTKITIERPNGGETETYSVTPSPWLNPRQALSRLVFMECLFGTLGGLCSYGFDITVYPMLFKRGRGGQLAWELFIRASLGAFAGLIGVNLLANCKTGPMETDVLRAFIFAFVSGFSWQAIFEQATQAINAARKLQLVQQQSPPAESQT